MKIITICSKIEDSVRTTSPPSSLISCFLPLCAPSPLSGVQFWLQRPSCRGQEVDQERHQGNHRAAPSADRVLLTDELLLPRSSASLLRLFRNLCNLQQNRLLTVALHCHSSVVLNFFLFEGLFNPGLELFAFKKRHIRNFLSLGAKHLCLFSLCTLECLSRCAACVHVMILPAELSCPAILRNERKRFTSCGVVLRQPGPCHTPQPRQMNGAIVHLMRP